MTKLFTFRASFLMSTLAATMFVLSCAGGETMNTGGSGGTTGSGGNTTTTGSGGRINSSGGSTFGSGGASNPGSGGATTTSGGSTGSSSGGSTGSSSGGATFGSGGASTTGSGGASTGTGSGGAPVTGGALTLTAGYASNGTWKGYAYTFTGPATGSKATITPAMLTTSFCSMGNIMIDSTYNSVAGMGFNVAQDMATTSTAPPTNTVATSGTGLAITVMATGLNLAVGGGSQLRAQVKTAAGDFCAGLAASGTNMIPWGMFDKTCWDTTAAGHGAFTSGTAIKAVELIIPSGAAAISSFNICIMDAKSY